MGSRSENGQKLVSLFSDYINCQRCDLYEHRGMMVFGDGNPNPDIVILVDRLNEFSLSSGDVLGGPTKVFMERMLTNAGIDPESVWIMASVLCLHEDVKKKPKVGEIAGCKPRVEAELHILRPRVVVALGSLAIKALYGNKSMPIKDNHGKVLEAHIAGDLVPYTVPVIVTYSLAELLMKPEQGAGGTWYRFMDSLKLAKQLVDDLTAAERGELSVEEIENDYREQGC